MSETTEQKLDTARIKMLLAQDVYDYSALNERDAAWMKLADAQREYQKLLEQFASTVD